MNEANLLMQKIDALCQNKEVTYKQAEREIGLSNGFFYKVSKRATLPKIDKIDAIADYFGVTRDYLIGNVPSFNNGKKSSGVKIPLLGKVAAGLPIEAAENLIGEEEITERLAASGTYFALLIKGDSMSPDIQNGDKVIVRQQSEVENGQIAIVLVNGSDAVCKEFRKTSSGVMLISRNPNYEPMIFTHDEVDTTPVRVIGRVVEVRREL